MSIFSDFRRLMRAGRKTRPPMDFAEAIHESANLAEAWSGFDWNQPVGTHGAMAANPFSNLQFMQEAIPAQGIVQSLAPTEKCLGEVPVYRVELEVRIDGREPYASHYDTVIGAAALPMWQPGASFPFRVSPDDPHALMLG